MSWSIYLWRTWKPSLNPQWFSHILGICCVLRERWSKFNNKLILLYSETYTTSEINVIVRKPQNNGSKKVLTNSYQIQWNQKCKFQSFFRSHLDHSKSDQRDVSISSYHSVYLQPGSLWYNRGSSNEVNLSESHYCLKKLLGTDVIAWFGSVVPKHSIRQEKVLEQTLVLY